MFKDIIFSSRLHNVLLFSGELEVVISQGNIHIYKRVKYVIITFICYTFTIV